MSAITVNRRDISLEETQDEEPVSFVTTSPTYSWEARLCGRASTGEMVDMTRYGATSAEALANLESAIAENGWDIR